MVLYNILFGLLGAVGLFAGLWGRWPLFVCVLGLLVHFLVYLGSWSFVLSTGTVDILPTREHW